METIVVPRCPADNGALHAALTQLAEQDPLINLQLDDSGLRLSLYGEVQKEVIEATLSSDFGIQVGFRETVPICVERPRSVGSAVERMGDEGNPFRATVGLRVEPGSGVSFRPETELGALPLAFTKAIEETVLTTLRQGLNGWQVIDVVVILTHSGYSPPASTGADFRGLVPLVVGTVNSSGVWGRGEFGSVAACYSLVTLFCRWVVVSWWRAEETGS